MFCASSLLLLRWWFGSFSRVLRLPLFAEGRDSFAGIAGRGREPRTERFERRPEAFAEPGVDELLRRLDRGRRILGDAARQLKGPRRESVGGYDLIDEPPGGSCRGVDGLAREDQLLRAARADDARQTLGAGPARHCADRHFREREARVHARDPQVASERELEPAAVSDAADRGNRRLAEAREPVERPMAVPNPALPHPQRAERAPFGNVGARAEGLRRSRDDDHRAHRGITLEPRARCLQRLEHRHRQRVQLVGAVERDRGDRAVDREAKVVAHVGRRDTISSFVPSCTTSPRWFFTLNARVRIPRSARLVSRFPCTVTSTWMRSPTRIGPMNFQFQPSDAIVRKRWSARFFRPSVRASPRMPCATRPLKPRLRANSSSTCRSKKSPEIPAKPWIRASLTTMPPVVNASPTAQSSYQLSPGFISVGAAGEAVAPSARIGRGAHPLPSGLAQP